MKPTKAQMEKVQGVEQDEGGTIYDLVPGFRSRHGEHVHSIYEPFDLVDYGGPDDSAREQFKSVCKCDCDECVKLQEAERSRETAQSEQ